MRRHYIPTLILIVLVMLAETALIISVSQARPAAATQVELCPVAQSNGQFVSIPSVAQPRRMVLTCADANVGLSSLTWHQWGQPLTSAKGTYWWNTCRPTCAAGVFVKTPATIELGKPQIYGGTAYYTSMYIDDGLTVGNNFGGTVPPSYWTFFPAS